MGNHLCTGGENLVRFGIATVEFYAKEYVRVEWIIVRTFYFTYVNGWSLFFEVCGCYVDRRRRENRGAFGAEGVGVRGACVNLPAGAVSLPRKFFDYLMSKWRILVYT